MLVDWKATLKTPKGDEIKSDEKVATLESIAYDLLLLHDPRAELSSGAKLKNARLACFEHTLVLGLEIQFLT